MNQQSSSPQYNPDPNIPVGFIGSDTQQAPQQMSRRMPSQRSRQMPQQRPQPEKRHILFFQPSCQHSQEFLKLLRFSKGLQNRFIQINVLTPNQKIPDKVQVTPTIFTVPDYNMYSADEAFKWLQQEIIKEQRNQNNPQQRRSQQIKNQTQQNINGGIRMNAPTFSGNGNGGTPNTRSGPAGQKPSESFNTYDPNRDDGVMPFMSDMGSNRSGHFSYLNVDDAPPFNYAHVTQDNQNQNQNQNQNNQTNPSMMQQRGRPKKLEDSKYDAFLAKRQSDPYIQQSMPKSY
jgi:hypothetical protein